MKLHTYYRIFNYCSFRPHGYQKPKCFQKGSESGDALREAEAVNITYRPADKGGAAAAAAAANGGGPMRPVSTASSIFDWNKVMGDVFDGKKPKKDDVHPALVKELLSKHYRELGESNI